MKDKTLSFHSQARFHSCFFFFRNITAHPNLENAGVPRIQNSGIQAPQCLRNQKVKVAQLLHKQIVEKPRAQGSVREEISYTGELMGNLVNTGQKPPHFPVHTQKLSILTNQ